MPSMTHRLHAVVATLIFALLGLFWTTRFTGAVIEDDAAQMTRMAVNLVHHGIMSVSSTPPYYASMYREPIPVLATALTVKVIDAVHGEAELGEYLSGDRARYLKLQNVFWLGLLAITTLAAVWLFTSAFWLALATSICVSLAMSSSLDSFYTEPAAAAVLMLTSLLLALAIKYGRWWIAAAGLSFGALALIKAAMLYVFIVFSALLACMYVLRRREIPARRALLQLGLLIGCFAIVVAPWMYRNYQEFGTLQIAERGGVVLMVRAVKNAMTPEEYRGAFYVWSPGRLKPVLGALLGFSARDLQRGGRLQRLNRSYDSDFAAADMAADKAGRPQDAISFYRRGRAERVKLRKQLEAAGDTNAEVGADGILQTRALQAIKEHPFKHLATTVPFLWRGAPFAFPIFAVMFGWALCRRPDERRRYDLGVFILPSFGMVLFYALLTHFIPRYGEPATPTAIVCGVLAIHAAYKFALAKLNKGVRSNDKSVPVTS